MIRPFRLRDVLTVRTLQRSGVWLDLFHHLLLRRSALTLALLAPIPWVGTGLANYVWTTQGRPRGFVQMLRRPRRQEADLLFMAPAVGTGSAMWEQFLMACAAQASAQGLRRLFAGAPLHQPEMELLAGLGWALYTTEDVVHLPRPASPRVGALDAAFRPRQARDVWWLRRLYSVYTPQPVQQAEGHQTGDDQAQLPLAWWELTNQSSFVIENNGEVVGGVQVVHGPRAQWLIVHGDPNNGALMARLVRFGVQTAGNSRQPVLCATRPYQTGLHSALQEQGFGGFAQRGRMVKHLVARVKVAEPVALPALVTEGQ